MTPDETTVAAQPTSVRVEMIDKIAALAATAFGLVAALAWNTAITAIFARYFPAGSQILGLLIYAVAVTVLAVLVTIWIGRVAGRVRAKEGGTLKGGPRGRPMA